MRFESRRCLAIVYARRGELDEAEQMCVSAEELIAPTESRISKLWLGSTYLNVLIANADRHDKDRKLDAAREKLQHAREYLKEYQQLVSVCQSPRFTREAEQFAEKLSKVRFGTNQ
jgi:cellobiose-specific phosphotransferase system component IIA